MGTLIKDIQKKLNLTIIFITHDRNESLTLSNKIALLKNRSLLQIGTPKEILYKPINKAAAKFMGTCNFIPRDIFESTFLNSGIYNNFIDIKDKNYEVFLRPHQIKIDKQKSDFIIMEHKNLGKEKIIRVTNGKIELCIETFSNEDFYPGDKIGINFNDKELHFIYLGKN